MEDKTTYELNIKKKSNVRLFKYEIFDYLIKNNIFKPNQGIQTIQEFVNILNPNNDYNIFHYILLSNGKDDTAENKFKKFVKVINFFKKSNNNSSVLTLLERKDKIGNLPLGYIISQGNIPLYHIYETLFQKNINRCLGYKNRSNLTILNMCENDIEKVMNNLISNYTFTNKYLKKINTKSLKTGLVEYRDLKTYKSNNPKIKQIVKITSLQTNFFNTLDNFISMHLSKQDYYTFDKLIEIIQSKYYKPQPVQVQPQPQAKQVQQPPAAQLPAAQLPAAQPQAKQVQQPPAAQLPAAQLPAAQPQAKQVQQPPAASLTTVPAASSSSSVTQTPTDTIQNSQSGPSKPVSYNYDDDDDDDNDRLRMNYRYNNDRERLIGDDEDDDEEDDEDDDDDNSDDDNGYNVIPMGYNYIDGFSPNIFSNNNEIPMDIESDNEYNDEIPMDNESDNEYNDEMPIEGENGNEYNDEIPMDDENGNGYIDEIPMDDENGNGYINKMPIEQDNKYSNVKSQIDKHRSNSSLSKSLSKSGVSKFVPLYKLTSEQNPNPNIPQPSHSMMLPQTKTVSTNPLSKSEIKTQFSIKSKGFKPPKLDRNIWKTPQQTTQTDKPAVAAPPVTSKSAFNVLSTSFIPGKSQTDKPAVAAPPVTSKSAFNALSTSFIPGKSQTDKPAQTPTVISQSFNPDYKPFKSGKSQTVKPVVATQPVTSKSAFVPPSTSFNPDYKPFKPSNSHTAASTPDTATQADKTGAATDSKKN